MIGNLLMLMFSCLAAIFVLGNVRATFDIAIGSLEWCVLVCTTVLSIVITTSAGAIVMMLDERKAA